MTNTQKNVEEEKTPSGSFKSDDKEPFRERLRSLLAGRSINQASRDWGINVSTLKNYFSRQSSTPRHEVLLKISSCEGISVDWLLYGDLNKSSDARDKSTQPLTGLSDGALKIAALIDLLDKEDVDALSKVLALKGVETVLYLLDDVNLELLKMDRIVKEKFLGKHNPTGRAAELNYEKSKECGSDSEEHTTDESLNPKKKAV